MLKQLKRTPRVNYSNELTTLYRFGLFEGQTIRRRCFYKPVETLEWSFCTCEKQTKRKRFTDLRGIRVCVEYYASELFR